MTPTHANISQVAPGLWIGGDLATHQPTLAAVQLREIAALGITTIVDCRLEWNEEDWVTAAELGIGYHWLGVDDAGQRMPDAWFDTGTAIIRDALEAGGTVLPHCHMGINRGPSMGYAAMLTLGGTRSRHSTPSARHGRSHTSPTPRMRSTGGSGKPLPVVRCGTQLGRGSASGGVRTTSTWRV